MSSSNKPLSLFIVEDNGLLRRHLVELLSGTPGLRVVGAVGTVTEALMAVPGQSNPDVALVDLNLPGPGGSGVDLLRAWRETVPVLLVHTVHDDRANILEAIQAGALGYILKGSGPRALIEAIFEAWAGGSPMSPKIARLTLLALQRDVSDPEELLSTRERQVLVQVERGLSYKEVGAELGISVNTVHSHIKTIYRRLQANDRTSAIASARRRHLL